MAPQSSIRTAVLQVPVPTEETQKLYNDWRRVEEQLLTARSLGRLSSGHSNSLEPPSPSQPTTMSRTPSASTTGSIARGIQGMAVNDGSPVTKRQKGKGRRGPLSEVGSLKTALTRKLRACKECSQRRVKVRDRAASPFFFLLFCSQLLTATVLASASILISSTSNPATKHQSRHLSYPSSESLNPIPPRTPNHASTTRPTSLPGLVPSNRVLSASHLRVLGLRLLRWMRLNTSCILISQTNQARSRHT